MTRWLYRSRTLLAIAAVGLGAGILFAIHFLAAHDDLEAAEVAHAKVGVARLAEGFAGAVRRAVDQAEASLSVIRDAHEAALRAGRDDPMALRPLMLALRRATPEANAILLIGADGRLRVDTRDEPSKPVSFAAGPFFRRLAGSPDRPAQVDPSATGRIDGVEIVPIAMRIDRPDGSFGGMIVVGVQPRFLGGGIGDNPMRLYRLFAPDGRLLAQWPNDAGIVGQSFAQDSAVSALRNDRSGEALAVFDRDGVERLTALHPVGSADLMVTVGLPTAEVLTSIRQHRRHELHRLIATEALIAAALGLLLALAARDHRLRQRQEANERRFHDIASASGDWLWETGPDLRFTFLSEHFPEVTGQDPAAVLGRNGVELRLGGEMPENWRRLMSDASNPRPFRDYIYTVPLPSRDPFVFKASGVPIFDAKGRFQGYRGVASDVTALTLAERKARQLENDLVRAQRMETLGAFAGGVAHDVNNALLPILTVVRSMMRREERPREYEGLALAYEAAQRCRDLVSGLLALIRKENVGDIAIDLKAPVADAISLLRKSLPRGIRFVTEIEPVPMPVVSAPVKVLQIVANLVTNAAQAIGDNREGREGQGREGQGREGQGREGQGREGRGEITLRLAPASELDGYLIEVIDDGPGIAAELHTQIFEPFFTTKPAEVGTGLGLSTVHSLVRGLSGKVTVVSAPGRGARFTVFLPRATAEVMEANLADARASASPQA